MAGMPLKRVAEHSTRRPLSNKVGITKLQPRVLELWPFKGILLSPLFIVQLSSIEPFESKTANAKSEFYVK